MQFNFSGHENVLSTHRNTLEFTKESNLSLKGDCILGVNADFDYSELMELVNQCSRIKVVISVEDLKEEIVANINKEFEDKHEIVIRRSEFASKRTLGIKADKVAIDVNRELVERLKNPNMKGKVEIIGLN